jgi:hypothetical protein
MGYTEFIILQLIAHLFYDFFFQNDLWIRHRQRYRFRSKVLYWHALIVFFVSWLFSFQLGFFVCSIVLAGSHLVLDGLKHRIANIKFGRARILKNGFFFVDQIIHISILILCVHAFDNWWGIEPLFSLPFGLNVLLLIIGYLLCLKPSNVFIREVFRVNNLKVMNQPGEDLLNAGKLIGNIERVLTLTLLLLGQFEAVGFIIAGKSILRYEGVKTSKTEYVLIGTLLSFGIAILISIIYSKLTI